MTLSKMGPILEFFGENIAGVDSAWDVEDVYFAIDDSLRTLHLQRLMCFIPLLVSEVDQPTHSWLSL